MSNQPVQPVEPNRIVSKIPSDKALGPFPPLPFASHHDQLLRVRIDKANLCVVYFNSLLIEKIEILYLCVCVCATTAQPVNPSRILRCQLGGSVRQRALRGTE